MSKKISDLIHIGVRYAICEGIPEFHIEGVFSNGEKYPIAIFEEDCEDICDEVAEFIKAKINHN